MEDNLRIDAIPLLVVMVSELVDRWNITYQELLEMSNKYHIFEMISVSNDYYNSMGINGIVQDLEEFIRKQEGSI